jgi:hypothetical protein
MAVRIHKSGFREETDCVYFDTLRYPGTPDPVESEGHLDDSSFEQWLNKVCNGDRRSFRACFDY